ncbi:MAG: type II toxin-antitoxin system VapC family toxin [Thermomicrobiales bacterium]
MPYLLDTDVVIDYLDRDVQAREVIDPLIQFRVAISMITYLEVFQGVLENPDPIKAEAEFETFLERVPILPLSAAVARRCAGLRRDLKRRSRRVRSRVLDLIIAATALEHDLTLVTRNKADYDDIPDLDLF